MTSQCPRLCYVAERAQETDEMPKTINAIHDIPGIEDYIRPGTSSSSVAHGLDPSRIPDFNSVIWRYMDFAQLVSLLDKEALFFCRADKLGDPFEGAWSDPTRKVLRVDNDKKVKVHDGRVSLCDVNGKSSGAVRSIRFR